MGNMSRRKGASAEREVFKLIGAKLGISVERNLTQTRDGGYDTRIGPWSIEVKRCEALAVPAWWKQACEQADASGGLPMLLYRRNRYPWLGVVSGYTLINVFGGGGIGCIDFLNDRNRTVTIDLDTAIELIRLNLPSKPL